MDSGARSGAGHIRVGLQVHSGQLHSKEHGLTGFGCILTQRKGILRDKPSYRVGFVKSQANSLAHTLDRAALFHACSQTVKHIALYLFVLLVPFLIKCKKLFIVKKSCKL